MAPQTSKFDRNSFKAGQIYWVTALPKTANRSEPTCKSYKRLNGRKYFLKVHLAVYSDEHVNRKLFLIKKLLLDQHVKLDQHAVFDKSFPQYDQLQSKFEIFRKLITPRIT